MKILNLLLALIMTTGIAMAQNKTGDAEVLGLLAAINTAEVDAAEAALKKNLDPKVADYARMMQRDHTQNLDQTLQLGKRLGIEPSETPAVVNQYKKADQDRAKIAGLNGEQFSKAYITSMVQGHIEALDIIDNQLMTKVENPDVRQHLAQTRNHIEGHLGTAKEIQIMLVDARQ